MSISDTLQILLKELQGSVKSETVFGEPITAGTTTLIPVTRISFGFSAAGSDKRDGASGSGGGVKVVPVALVSVTVDGDVTVHRIDKRSTIDRIVMQIVDLAPDHVVQRVKAVFDKEKGRKRNAEQKR
ncbi:MAG: GerW family sporulation protein [Fibrobacterota bacterium]